MILRNLILFCLLSLCLIQSQRAGVTLNEVLSIGGEGAGTEDFLAQPIATGENDRYIYVADIRLGCIKMYTHDGKFVKQIGREGRGPGEFGAISGMHVDNEDLVVMDDQLMRFTKFTVEGEINSTHFYSDLGIIVSPRGITKMDNGNYLIIYATGSNRGSDVNFQRSVIHEVSPDFKEVITSFGEKELIFGNYEEYSNLSEAQPGYITQIDDKVIFAPRIYGGKLFVFEKEMDTWNNSVVLENDELNMKPFEILSAGRSRNPEANYRAFLPDGVIKNYYIQSFSHEIATYKRDLLVHFVSADTEGEEKTKMAEVYDLESGELIYFGEPEIQKLQDSSPGLSYRSISLGRNGHVFDMEIEHTPVVRKFAFEFNRQ